LTSLSAKLSISRRQKTYLKQSVGNGHLQKKLPVGRILLKRPNMYLTATQKPSSSCPILVNFIYNGSSQWMLWPTVIHFGPQMTFSRVIPQTGPCRDSIKKHKNGIFWILRRMRYSMSDS